MKRVRGGKGEEEKKEVSLPLARFVFNLCVFQNCALKYERERVIKTSQDAAQQNIIAAAASGKAARQQHN